MIAIDPWFARRDGAVQVYINGELVYDGPASAISFGPEPMVFEARPDVQAFLKAVDELEERTARSRALAVPSRAEATRRANRRRPPAAPVLQPAWPVMLKAFC